MVIDNKDAFDLEAAAAKQGKEMVDKINKQMAEEGKTNEAYFKEILDVFANVEDNKDGLNEMAVLFSLPEEQFYLIAPVVMKEVEKSFGNTNEQIAMVQALNLKGLTVENVRQEYENLCGVIDTALVDMLPDYKRDFLKALLGISYNAIAAADGIAKEILLVPIEMMGEDSKMPNYAHVTDSGMDVYSTEEKIIAPGERFLIHTGVKIAIPNGYELQVRPKSGISLKTGLRVANTPGTIDAGFRDEICVIVENVEPFIKYADISADGKISNVLYGNSYTIEKGQKIAQLVLARVPKVSFYKVETVSDIGENRNGGFGSTGLK